MSDPICVIVTGLSGAGKSIAIDCFEDFGFFCVDNLPIALIPKLMDICQSSSGRFDRLALGLDIRAGEQLAEFFDNLQYLGKAGYKQSILFLEATDATLIRRYSFSRRKHPIGGDYPIQEQIRQEREKLKELRNRADFVLDTSSVTPQALRNSISETYLQGAAQQAMLVTVTTFGYKNGLPLDADLVFDVRFLPNPFHEPDLRHLTGDDPPVEDFLWKSPITKKFLEEVQRFMEFLIPCFIEEGKSYLTIALGCTGGKHRSVFIANQLKKYFHSKGTEVILVHRDIGKE